MSQDVDTSRAVVKAYVPAYQKERWREHANELGMSQSEFFRTMVQAGRRGFGGDHHETTDKSGDERPASEDDDSGGNPLEEHILAVLSDGEHHDWDAIVSALTEDIEDRIEEVLQSLQSENRVQYSGRHGGYSLVAGDGSSVTEGNG